MKISSYADLLATIRARMAELQLTYELLDHLSGVQQGYSNKILGPKPSKTLGHVSFAAIVGALALRVTIEVDEAAVARLQHRWTPRRQALPVRAEMAPIAPQMAAGESSAAAPAYMPS